MYSRHVVDQALFLREMPEETRAALAAGAVVRRYRAGEFLWRVGDREDGLHVIAEGLVTIGNIGPDGEEVVLQAIARGACIGEPSIFAPGGERRTDGRAVGRTTIVWLPSEVVRAALEASPEAMRVFVRQVSVIARMLARRVALTAFHDARGRLARVLLDLAESHGVPAGGGLRIELRLSQRTLAGLVGVRREHVNRLVSAFERDGAITVVDGLLTILDEAPLRAALGIEAGLP